MVSASRWQRALTVLVQSDLRRTEDRLRLFDAKFTHWADTARSTTTFRAVVPVVVPLGWHDDRQETHVLTSDLEQSMAAEWWWPAGWATAGALLGTGTVGLTRRFLFMGGTVARSRWFSAVLTAAVLALLSWRIGTRGEVFVYGVVAALGVPLAVIDWCEHRLPRGLVLPQLVGAAVGFAALSLIRADTVPGLRALWALLASAGFCLVLALATGGGIGAGDVRLAAVVGLVTGWSGWPAVAAALLVASVLALALSAIPRARTRDERGAAVVPFGPCLLGGVLAVVMVTG
ncbi:prepilin peptidase [Amycolatopsis thermoflava]|uniref:prepilin peptidase n=1 Tax=Amycolatopsis thermoflava TaxID=84480 RepID=UPI003D73ADB2